MFLKEESWYKFTNCQTTPSQAKRKISLDAPVQVVFIDSWILITFQLLFLWNYFKKTGLNCITLKRLIIFPCSCTQVYLRKIEVVGVFSVFVGVFFNSPLNIKSGNVFWKSESTSLSPVKLTFLLEAVYIQFRDFHLTLLISSPQPLKFCQNT